MITVDEAYALVLSHCRPKPAARVPVAEALGLALAESIASDVDSPPWDKSMVDGYAVQARDLGGGSARLRILEEVVAGDVPRARVEPGTATRIMTGAPTPAGCDAIVMVEKTRVADDGSALGLVEINDTAQPGKNILRRGSALTAGQIVLEPGHQLRAIEIGLLCEVGRTEVAVIPAPRVAVLSTGNELIGATGRPGPGQIRNSNGPMLAAACRQAAAVPIELGIARDDRDALRTLIAQGLGADIVVLSGGVSAGVLDLVPRVLAELGVEQVFHKIRLKPGKPLWFGVRDSGEQRTLVFGLPGNPVSSLVCFELFVRGAIAQVAGRCATAEPWQSLPLAKAFDHKGDRPTYHPARTIDTDAGVIVEPVRSQGSADLRGLAMANALLSFPPGDRRYEAGELALTRRL